MAERDPGLLDADMHSDPVPRLKQEVGTGDVNVLEDSGVGEG